MLTIRKEQADLLVSTVFGHVSAYKAAYTKLEAVLAVVVPLQDKLASESRELEQRHVFPWMFQVNSATLIPSGTNQ